VDEAEQKIKKLYAKLAEKEYNSALIYEKMEYYTAAINYYKNVKDTYHDSKFAPLAHYRMIKLLILKNRTDEALRSISEYINKYPDDPNVEELKSLNQELIVSSDG